MKSDSQKVSFVEKVGYRSGWLSCKLSISNANYLFSLFYTDIYGLKKPMMHQLWCLQWVWRPHFFQSHYWCFGRPYYPNKSKISPHGLFVYKPITGVVAFLSFSTPHFEYKGKLIYAAVTYTFLLLLYASSNLPYSALSGVITGDMGERNSISSSFCGGYICAVFCSGFYAPDYWSCW